MHYLFSHLDEVKTAIIEKPVSLLLDYDGTLTPIRKTPAAAIIHPKVRSVLKAISKNKNIKVAIISGRSLRDIKKIVGIKKINYFGNHGFEFEDASSKRIAFVPLYYKKIIAEVKSILKNKISSIKGALLEDKGFTLSLHYRLVKAGDILKVKDILFKLYKEKHFNKNIRINHGKKVFEIKPRFAWNKGKAVSYLLSKLKDRRRFLPIYIGDDTTDEDAFRALKSNGITVCVGKNKKSNARYCLNNTGEVLQFLKIILDVKRIIKCPT